MRKTISSFTSGFSGMLNGQGAATEVGGRQEDIRTAMLAALSEVESTHPSDFSKTLVMITQAKDIQSLWYARSELLRFIADRDGEQAARHTLDAITEMFRGLVPHNQMPSRRRFPR